MTKDKFKEKTRITIHNCSRCGEDHYDVIYRPPIKLNGYPSAVCPKTQQFLTLPKNILGENL